ncbi:MAG: DUF167 domain-containing protein [Dehalococcoidia bacterium]
MAYLNVRVTPGARQDSVAGWRGDTLRLRVRAAPERGKATEAACQLLADCLGVPANRVSLARGATSRDKLLHIQGLSDDEVRRLLAL